MVSLYPKYLLCMLEFSFPSSLATVVNIDTYVCMHIIAFLALRNEEEKKTEITHEY